VRQLLKKPGGGSTASGGIARERPGTLKQKPDIRARPRLVMRDKAQEISGLSSGTLAP